MEFNDYHKPIMLNECMYFLKPNGNGIYFDGTLGGGGHSEAILKLSSPNGRLIATDKDEDAIEYASKRLSVFGDRVKIVKSDFKDVKNVLKNLGVNELDGALLDLGVSSFQLDNFDRGFSYRSIDSVLDMRMDKEQSFSALDIINSYSESDLRSLLFKYGEESFSSKIARNIVLERQKTKITTTGQLCDIIKKSVPFKALKNGHPAKKTFQAIRIEVNQELIGLEQAIFDFCEVLKKGARFCVITFHSLEDRIVKGAFKYLELDCICDKKIPICVCDKKKECKVLSKKPIVASEQELQDNRRAESAKLRVIEKV